MKNQKRKSEREYVHARQTEKEWYIIMKQRQTNTNFIISLCEYSFWNVCCVWSTFIYHIFEVIYFTASTNILCIFAEKPCYCTLLCHAQIIIIIFCCCLFNSIKRKERKKEKPTVKKQLADYFSVCVCVFDRCLWKSVCVKVIITTHKYTHTYTQYECWFFFHVTI